MFSIKICNISSNSTDRHSSVFVVNIHGKEYNHQDILLTARHIFVVKLTLHYCQSLCQIVRGFSPVPCERTNCLVLETYHSVWLGHGVSCQTTDRIQMSVFTHHWMSTTH